VRLYADENFPLAAVHELRELGHDVLTSLEAGNANQRIPDEDVLSFATMHRRAVLTMNRRNFVRLHRNSDEHAGIIVCTQFGPAEMRVLAEVIDAEIAPYSRLDRTLVRVNRPQRR
jgi:hypothetical protein